MDERVKLRERLEGLSTDELVSIVASCDTDEWRPEVFPLARTILANRGIRSIAAPDRGEPQEPADPIMPPEDADPIATGLDLHEADDVDRVLSAAGLPAQVVPSDYYGFQVYVPKEHEVAALKLLREANLLPVEDAGEPITLTGGVCPGCGALVQPEVGECPHCGLAV